VSVRLRGASSEEGFATVVAAGLALVLMVVAAAVAAAGSVVAARHRAEAVADLAALAAAQHALAGHDAACAAARELTEEEHVVLLTCRLDGADALVTTAMAAPGRLAVLGLVHGEARAGRR
jgi:secretion/DNA translocation related TadE-like protein